MPNKQNTKNSNSNLPLIIILAICLVVLSVLVVLVLQKFKPVEPSVPAVNTDPQSPQTPQTIEIPNLQNMNVQSAKDILSELGVEFEIVPTDSRIANRVEKITGYTVDQNGKMTVNPDSKILIHSNEVAKDKVIYLTFDDGPTRDNTDYILATLDKYDIKATFFVEGNDVNIYPQKIQATFDAGHLIGCHSYSHDFSSIYNSTDAFIQEVIKYENALKNALGEEKYASVQKLIRFPGGTDNNALTKENALDYIQAVRELGYRVYDWTCLTGDANPPTPVTDTQGMIDFLNDSISLAKSQGKPLIALLHDKWPVKEDDSLSAIIENLIAQGYYFDTIDTCEEYTFAEN